MPFSNYNPEHFYDEYFSAPGQPRPETAAVVATCQELGTKNVYQAQAQALQVLEDLGAIIHTETDGSHVLHLDVMPRIITAAEWKWISAGLKQRIAALNLFCVDVYGKQQIIRDGKIPREVVESTERLMPECMGLKPAQGIWCHVNGLDLVRDQDGEWRVLEDNLRTPCAASYMVRNRQTMAQVLPQLFEDYTVEPVDDYPQQLRSTLLNLGPRDAESNLAMLTPGTTASHHLEHVWLAQQAGLMLVYPAELVIADGYLQRSSPQGLERIDVLYRQRNAEDFDTLDFGPQFPSRLAALMDLCHQGRLTVVNAFGTGVADDKVIYTYVPDMIRYYLGEEPMLANVPSYRCRDASDCHYVLDHLDELVVKRASGEGGYGMLIGPHASPAERTQFAAVLKAHPERYMAQPTIYLSRIPTAIGGQFKGRHVDFRPYILHQGDDIYVHPGGLTRVALTEGSLVVNLAQGGGSKDTWVLADPTP